MTGRRVSWMALGLLFAANLASAAALPLIVDVENSKGLRRGDAVMLEGKRIGEVTDVGFGDHDTVEIRIAIDGDAQERIHKAGTFVVDEPGAGKRPTIEYFVIDAKSPLAEPNMRFQGARSLAEVWLLRGRISADELSRAMSQGVEQFRRNLEELQHSPEWGKFKEQIARLSARLTVTSRELAQLLNDQLPKLQKELDDLYAQYQKELQKAESQPTPTP
jgi:ABC-type transporter Mla subunit MlaD